MLCEDDCGDGACAATFCNPDGICVYEALFEMRPCPLGTGSSGNESGSSNGESGPTSSESGPTSG